MYACKKHSNSPQTPPLGILLLVDSKTLRRYLNRVKGCEESFIKHLVSALSLHEPVVATPLAGVRIPMPDKLVCRRL